MALYNLATDGVRELSRSGLFREEKVVREPLDGIPDGTNLVFRTSFAPLVSGQDVTVFDSMSGGSMSAGSYAVDHDTGTVLFTSAPASQPAISYYWSNLTQRQFLQALIDGFDVMEAFWPRGWQLSSDSAVYAAADEDDAAIYVVAGQNVNDPDCGDAAFSASRPSRAIYQCCCRIAYLDGRMIMAAEDDIDYREDRGISVKKSHRVASMGRALEAEFRKLDRMMREAFANFYDDEDIYGRYYSSPATETYLASYEWQYYSKLQDLRVTYRFRGV